MKIRSLLLLVVAFLGLTPSLRAQFVISEFLASNSNSIVDEDGSHSDWIEIANNSLGAANLLGWYLTDDANQPRKWAFPSKTLGGGAYLVVFASNKNRTNPAANLHTNFKLDTSPSYLALTQDIAGGGVQVVQAFNPYPQQATDISYGTSTTITTTPLLATGAAAKTLIPSVANGGSALGAAWRGGSEPFTDSGWTSGTTAVGFPNAGVATANLRMRLNANTPDTLISDTSGIVRTGTNNVATWVAETTDAAGRTRHGTMQFNATDSNGTATGDQVIIKTNNADTSAAKGTIMFWIKTAGNVADGGNVQGAMLADQRSGSGQGAVGLGIYLADDGTVKVQAGDGILRNTAASTVSVKDNRWHHVALVYSQNAGEACTFYVDGVAGGTQNNSSQWFLVTTQLELGRSHDTFWRRLNGQLDDFRFYGIGLTPAQILQIYNDEDEPLTPGTNVQAAMLGVNPSAFIRVPFTVADPTVFSGLNLTMRWNDGYVAWLNGVQVASFAVPASLAFDSAATQSHSAGAPFITGLVNPASYLHAGTNMLAIQALNNSAANGVFSALPTLDGLTTNVSSGGYLAALTPGAANSAAKSNLGPFVSNVTQNPSPRPTGTAASPPLTITAKVLPSLRPLAASTPVKLKYVIMFGAEVNVDMTLTATPNVYTANIPTSAVGPGQMLRWRVVATDNTAVTGTAPAFFDPLNTEQYYGTVAVDPSIASNLPVFYWFVPTTGAADNQSGVRCSFFFRAPNDTGVGTFYDNVGIDIHGQSSQGFPKKSYDINFNEDNRFAWDTTQSKVKAINLLTNWGDKSKTHNVLTHEVCTAIGSAAHWAYQVRVQQVTTANLSTPATQFFSIADMMENAGDEWLDRIGRDPDGSLYKIYDDLSNSSSAEKKTRTYEDKSDLDALIAGLDPNKTLNARRLYAYDNLDLTQCASYFVGMALASDQDLGHKNYYVYRDTPNTREWSIFPWDVDLSWGRNWTDAQGYFTDTITPTNVLNFYPGYNDGGTVIQNKGTMNRLYSLMFDCPEFRKMYLRRLRTAMDTYFDVPGYLEGRVDAMTEAMDPSAIGTSDADLDYTKWGSWGVDGGFTTGSSILRYHTGILKNSYLGPRRTFLNSANAKLYFTGGGFETIPASQPADAANLITIETIDFNPASGTQDHEYFVIRNANTYAVDLSGWQITNAINLTFKPGTVIPPGAGTTDHIGDLFVAKNPYLFRQRPSGPGGGQDCFVQGPYSGQLSARGETLELRDATGTLLKSKSWAGAPTPMQNALRIVELNYAPAPPTPAESAALPGVAESDFEYIELMNIGGTPLTLTGAHFDQGIDFTFPTYTLAAGARCLLVGNLAGFQLRYGHAFDAQIAGVYLGNLDNNGEEIQLLDNVGENVLDFTYNNSWYPPSDEGGRTLVVRNVNADWSNYGLPTNWALSGNPNGSPGAADADFANVYEGWRNDYFTPAEFPTQANPNAPAAMTVDVDADGLSNLGEYAFGRNPRAAEAIALATSTLVNVAGTNYAAIVFTRRHKALDLTYVVQVSSDLAGWTAVDLPVGSPVDLGNGLEQVTYRDSQPASAGQRFLRVRATK